MLECVNCGASGEDNFSTNYFGELVCELCGTQSFQQARNETQDVDDMAMDPTQVSRTLRRTTRRSKRRRDPNAPKKQYYKKKSRTTDVELLDCLVATQHVLQYQVRELMARVGGFPPEYPRVVRDLWFRLLDAWESKSHRPLLRSFTEYYLPFLRANGKEGDELDQATTLDLLAQWDAERLHTDNEEDEKEDEQAAVKIEEILPGFVFADGRVRRDHTRTGRMERTRWLDRLDIIYLPAIMWLAARVLSLPLLPCDFAYWTVTGELPYANLLEAACSPELRARVVDVKLFFETSILRNHLKTAKLSYTAYCVQNNLELCLPPLNAPLVACAIAENLGLPPLVSRNFQWITGLMNAEGEVPEPPLITGKPRTKISFTPHDLSPRMLDSGVGIAAHMIVAIKMCPNWFTWVFERVGKPLKRDSASGESGSRSESERLDRADLEPHLSAAPSLPRRELAAFLDLCERAFANSSRRNIPDAFVDHAAKLQSLESYPRDAGRRRAQDELKEPTERLRTHELRSYPPLYEDGAFVETDADIEAHLADLRSAELRHRDGYADSSSSKEIGGPVEDMPGDGDEELRGSEEESEELQAYFYPLYDALEMRRTYHPVYENMVEMLCEYVDAPIAVVLRVVRDLDLRLEALCIHLGKKRTKANTIPQPDTH